MSNWKRISIMAMTFFLLVLPLVKKEAYADKRVAEAAVKKANEVTEFLIQDYGVTGVQYAIRDNGKVVLSGGQGVNDAGELQKIASDTMFGIGSISKMYVTSATMMLADAGLVDIDMPLTAYIKEFKMKDERYKQITPRMLMNHSSGLYGSHYKNSMLFDDNDTQNHDQLLENLSRQKLKSEPGQYSVYANDGFQLLEILVERVSGMSYSEFLAQKINKPLKLVSTKTPLDKFDRKRLYPVIFPFFDNVLPTENANVIGTGGIYSTAEELTLFSDVLIGNYPTILSKESALLMQKPEYRNGIWVKDEVNTFNYGLGWDSVDLAPFQEYGIRAVTKGGDTVLYHSALIALPELNISIAVLTSGGMSLYNTTAASTILLEYLKQTGHIKEINPEKVFNSPVKKDMPDALKSFSGLYGTVGSTFEINILDGEVHLPAMIDGLIPEQTYIYIGNEHFSSHDGRTTISFDKQKNNHIYLSVTSHLTYPGLGQSIMAYYEAQKLDRNTLTEDVLHAWEKRNGKTYYAVDEKISSLFYFSPLYLSKTMVFDSANGYVNGTKVIDQNNTENSLEIPVMNGRDVTDFSLEWIDGIEYLLADGRTFISEDAITSIYEGKSSTATISSSGHARWYKISDAAAGKTMTVDFKDGSGFAVYNEYGLPDEFNTATGNNKVILPKNGLIVFAGKPGDKFKIKLDDK